MSVVRSLFAAPIYIGVFASLSVAGNWGKSRVWDDGRAEVAVYDSEITLDGKPRAFKEHLLTMQQDFKEKKNRALKLIQVQDVPVENYTRHVLTSVIVKEEAVAEVVALTVNQQDWVGAIYKMYNASPDGNGGSLYMGSDADGAAGSSSDLTLQKEDYFEDQLPLSLRALPFTEGFEKKIRVWDSLASASNVSPLVTEAMLKVTGEEPIRCRAGSIPCWIVTLKRPTGTDTFWIEKKEPNLLVKMETQDGRKRMLYSRARWKYWDRRLPRPNILN